MVNHGRSAGCVTCKERRVKCDEAKPRCRMCQRLRLPCGGYQAVAPGKLKFKDQSHKFPGEPRHAIDEDGTVVARRVPSLPQHVLDHDGTIVARRALPSPRPALEPNTAVPFFLSHYASMGRDMGSSRGFFEMLIPTFSCQRQDSPLAVVLTAVATQMLNLWRGNPNIFKVATGSFGQAVRRLRTAIRDPTERAQPATMLAVLVLQFHENLAAVYGHRPVVRTHQDGAASLLPFAEAPDSYKVICAYMRRHMLHVEVASAIQDKRPLQSSALSWIGDEALMAVSTNPSSALDAIGAVIANLLAKFTHLDSRQALEDCKTEAIHLEAQLLAWESSVPKYWHPLKLISGRDIDRNIPTYQSICEVYPSCQIATIWNLWRCYRLILINIMLSPEAGQDNADLTYDQPGTHHAECVEDLKALIDSICYSVPFHVGNRTHVGHLSDLTNPSILLPSYHSLPPEDERRSAVVEDGFTSSREDHRRHVIAQGLWHIMGPLSRLLMIFSEEHGRRLASFIRPGQLDWIRQQFLRVTNILYLQPDKFNIKIYGFEDVPTKATHIAKRIRRGAALTGGP